MIYKVNLISKRAMANDQHNALMSECMQHLVRLSNDNAKYKEAYDAFKAAFEEEEKYFKMGTKNPYTEPLSQATRRRVFLYNGMRQYLELQISVGFEAAAASQKLLDVLDLFKAEMKKNVMGQSAAMRNILADLAQEEYQTALAQTNAMFLYTNLVEADTKVEKLLVNHRAHNRDWVAEALKKARQRMDEAYDGMAHVLNGCAALFGEPFITAIKDWNSSIDAFKLSKKRRDAMRKKANETDANPADPNANAQPKPDSGQNTNPNANPKPGTDGSQSQNPNGPNPADPNAPTGGKPGGDAGTEGQPNGGTDGSAQGEGSGQNGQNGSGILTPAVPEEKKQTSH